MENADSLIRKALEYNDNQFKLFGIGVGITGIVERDGTVQESVHLGWRNVAFRGQWEEKYGVPVSVDNEVNFAALGESYYGSALNDTHFIYVEVGYGVGSGIVIDGKLFRGANGYAGELGFMMMDCPEIVPWETGVNIPAVLAHIRHRIQSGETSVLNEEQLSFQAMIDAQDHGDPLVVDTLVQISRRIGVGIASVINILDMPLIILGGELGKRLEPYLDIIQDEINCHVIRANRKPLNLRVSTLQPDACLMGAIAQVFDEVLQEPSWQASL